MDNVEVEINQSGGKAVIEGKTSVPFRTFVGLVLQRKVQTLFKRWQDEPVILSGELLTSLASAPSDQQDDRGKLVLVTFGTGIVAGVFGTIVTLLALALFNIHPGNQDLLLIAGSFVLVAIVVYVLIRTQRSAGKQRLYDSMEKVKDLILK
jgi:hypothetical protein